MLASSSHSMGQSVGARLRQARLAKKYTQNQLARPDFSVSYISAIERGQIQPSLRALEILAQRLELSTTDLLPVHTVVAGTLATEAGNPIPGNDEREFLVLEARIAIYQGHAARAVELLQGLLPQKSEKRHEQFCEVYTILGWAYLIEGRLQESEQLLATAARLSKETPGPFYLCILSLQSAVYKAMHNSEQAVQVQRESLRVLAQPSSIANNLVLQAQLHSSLAQHYSSIGEYEQAGEHFRRTLHLFQAQASNPQKQEHYQALLRDYANKELYFLATLYGYKGLLADWRYLLKDTRNDIEYALGRVLLKKNPDEARAYLRKTAQEAATRQDHLSLAGANAQLARELMARDQLDQAEALIHLVQEHMASFEGTLVSADIQLLAGELAYRRQDYSVGDSFFEQGLAILEQIGAQEDLIEQLARYAQLLEERNCIQKSIFYWKLAYESRQKNRMLVL